MTNSGELKIIQPGPFSILQDLGRQGFMHLGFSQSGAMDEQAYLWANKLLNNHKNAAALEITFGPFIGEFSAPAKIALTGAANPVYINEIALPSWQTFHMNTGDKLRITAPKYGLRTYLAIEHGFHFQSPFNSAAMVVKEKSGPFQGIPFKKGQILQYPYNAINSAAHTTPSTTPNTTSHTSTLISPSAPITKAPRVATPTAFIPDYQMPLTLKIFLNAHYEEFAQKELCRFFNTDYQIGQDSNRMAIKLIGYPIKRKKSTPLLSSGTAFGAVQLPPNGQPIILLKDRQTIGGYPQLGCIAHLDCFALSQRHPGQKVRFEEGNIEKSQEALAEFYAFFNQGESLS